MLNYIFRKIQNRINTQLKKMTKNKKQKKLKIIVFTEKNVLKNNKKLKLKQKINQRKILSQ